jgi:hypothetical protein
MGHGKCADTRNEKMTARRASGTISSLRAMSATIDESLPFAPYRSATQRTDSRVVSEQARATPATRKRRASPRTVVQRETANHSGAATAAAVTSDARAPRTTCPALVAARRSTPKPRPMTRAIQPSATCVIGSNVSSVARSRSPDTLGPRTKPRMRYSAPEGSPKPRMRRSPTRKLPI